MRTKKGIITSAKMTNTVTVAVTRYVVHPKYRKRYPVTKKFLADTNSIEVKEGDTVLIGETRPLSKKKCFKVLEVLISGTGIADVSLEEELKNEMKGGEEEKGDSKKVHASKSDISSDSL
jgi:small subunit ribosomal protein S17